MRIFVITFFSVLIPILLHGQEYAKILDHHTKYIIKNEKDVEMTTSYTLLINSEKGKKFEMYYDYFDDFKTIKNVEIIVKDSKGKKIKRFTKSDGIKVNTSSSYEMSDNRYLIIDPKYQQYPYTLEITTSIKWNGFVSLPVWIPQNDFNLAVDNAVLEIMVHDQFDVKIKEENISMASETKNDGGWKTKVYKVASLPHIDENIRFKDFYQDRPKVYISPLHFKLGGTSGTTGSWKEFGDWFLKLNGDDYVLTDKTKLFLDNLDKNDSRELINNIYKYMQDKTRYISIQLGIGGYKSISTKEVEAKGYGDCKALTTYMKNLLDYVGIKSNYVLVRAGDDVPDVNAEFVSNQFNHVFLGIPLKKDTIYLECTNQDLPADYIGTFTDDRNVLWISKEGSSIIRSRIYSHSDNLQKNTAKITLDKEGNGKIYLKTENNGVFFDDILVYKGASETYIKAKNIKSFPYKDFVIKDFAYHQATNQTSQFTSDFTMEVNGLAKIVSEKLVLSANLLRPITSYIDYDEYLNYADILRGLTVKDEVEVVLGNYWINKMPEEVYLSSNYGDYKLTFKTDSEKIIIVREIILFKGNYTKADFNDFKKFVNEIKIKEMQKMVLNSKT